VRLSPPPNASAVRGQVHRQALELRRPVLCSAIGSTSHTVSRSWPRQPLASSPSCTSSSWVPTTRGSGSGARGGGRDPTQATRPRPDPYPATRAACAGAGAVAGANAAGGRSQDGGQQAVARASRAGSADHDAIRGAVAVRMLAGSGAHSVSSAAKTPHPHRSRRKAVDDTNGPPRGRIRESVTLL
jgi:hypothetical protein